MIDKIHVLRNERCVLDTIGALELDLQGLTVYTELGSGTYAWTPVIAALAGADRVFAYTRTSRFGSAGSNVSELNKIARTLGKTEIRSRISVVSQRVGAHVSEADIVTNTGFIRPIDGEMVHLMKERAVVPLMYETWEFREQDVDVESCESRRIPVLGTNEKALPIDMMRYGGFLASKLLFDCGMDVHMDRIVVIGKGRLAANISRFFALNGVTSRNLKRRPSTKIDLHEWDAIVVAEFDDRGMTIGPGGTIEPLQIANENPLIQIVHICGTVDEAKIHEFGLAIHPRHARTGYMTVTADYLGPKATIQLNAAGLKVGEIMARYRRRHDYERTLELSTKHDIVDGWEKKIGRGPRLS